jgi:hypothetical protein
MKLLPTTGVDWTAVKILVAGGVVIDTATPVAWALGASLPQGLTFGFSLAAILFFAIAIHYTNETIKLLRR